MDVRNVAGEMMITYIFTEGKMFEFLVMSEDHRSLYDFFIKGVVSVEKWREMSPCKRKEVLLEAYKGIRITVFNVPRSVECN
mgnify:CR=1 FL=1